MSFTFPLVLAAALTLYDYSQGVRSAVEGKFREALAEREAEDSLLGTVSLSTADCFFLQGEEDAMKVVRAGGAGVAPGSRVKVTGPPSLEGGRVVFVASGVEKTGDGVLPEPVPADSLDLVYVARSRAECKSDVNWRRVKVSGRAMGLTESGFAFEVDDMPITVFASRLPAFLDDCGQTCPKLEIVGVAELILDQASLLGRPARVMGVKLHVADASDIKLLPDLRYRLNRRERKIRLAVAGIMSALGMALVVLVAFFVRQGRRHLRTATLMRERKRMADDLHDTIEQHLVSAGMLLQLGKAAEARRILLQARREMRDIVWGLKNDDMMRLSPAEMIREYARAENRKGVCRFETRLAGLPDRMEASAMRDLSLIIREAAGNAMRHGGAKKVAISCEPHGGGWLMRIANDGSPYNPSEAPGPAEGHFGLEGMRARARRLGAELSISVRGAWTVVSVECAGTGAGAPRKDRKGKLFGRNR